MKNLPQDTPYFLKDFITYMEAIRGKSKNTVNAYYYDLRLFEESLGKT